MPTNRTRRTRNRRSDDAPSWAEHFAAGGGLPDPGTDDWREMLNWYFFDARVPGLPQWDTAEGRALMNAVDWPL